MVVVEPAKHVPLVFYYRRKARVSSKRYTQDLADAPGVSGVLLLTPRKVGTTVYRRGFRCPRFREHFFDRSSFHSG